MRFIRLKEGIVYCTVKDASSRSFARVPPAILPAHLVHSTRSLFPPSPLQASCMERTGKGRAVVGVDSDRLGHAAENLARVRAALSQEHDRSEQCCCSPQAQTSPLGAQFHRCWWLCAVCRLLPIKVADFKAKRNLLTARDWRLLLWEDPELSSFVHRLDLGRRWFMCSKVALLSSSDLVVSSWSKVVMCIWYTLQKLEHWR